VVAEILTSFLLAFSALFSIVTPLGGALIYSQVIHIDLIDSFASLSP
jgi:hypothetical protein